MVIGISNSLEAMLASGKTHEDETQDLTAAIEKYREAVKLYSNDSQPYLGLSRVLFKKGDYEESIKYAKKSLKIDADNPAAFNSIALAYEQIAEKEFGMKNFKKTWKSYVLAIQNYWHAEFYEGDPEERTTYSLNLDQALKGMSSKRIRRKHQKLRYTYINNILNWLKNAELKRNDYRKAAEYEGLQKIYADEKAKVLQKKGLGIFRFLKRAPSKRSITIL
ncbi:tetratricopeptide repeat protein [Candidatus Woesearchaeota archaeon]|nr:tetratricopeptide repeat protein [Candidatus Woesearchaeota archaeon]